MQQTKQRPPRWVGWWLLGLAGMVLAMAVIGAITRLTESGLSITVWEPVMGALPPLTLADWQAAFDLYRESPQYQLVNAGMSLEEFQTIYWWEWIHRQWGRLIGLVFALPLLGLLLAKRLPARWAAGLTVLLLLGGLQGLMGWVMVQSGLVDQPAVSHFRLAAHLALAALIFALLLLASLMILRPQRDLFEQRADRLELRRALSFALVLIGMTLIYGAFVAGLRAGLIYNSFPDFNGALLPAGIGQAPFWNLVLYDAGTVQMLHRLLALFTLFYIWGITLAAGRKHWPKYTYALLFALVTLVFAQVFLGILTLLWQVPLIPAVTHQAFAFLLLGVAVALRYELRGT